MENLDTLSKILFEGEEKVLDIKAMPGSSEEVSVEEDAKCLLDSMKRMGIVVGDKLSEPA